MSSETQVTEISEEISIPKEGKVGEIEGGKGEVEANTLAFLDIAEKIPAREVLRKKVIARFADLTVKDGDLKIIRLSDHRLVLFEYQWGSEIVLGLKAVLQLTAWNWKNTRGHGPKSSYVLHARDGTSEPENNFLSLSFTCKQQKWREASKILGTIYTFDELVDAGGSLSAFKYIRC